MIGGASFRRLLKRLPQASTDQLVKLLQVAGPRLAALMRARLPTRTGALDAAIDWKVTPRTLTLKVGLTTRGKASRYFYGHILDVGRKGKTVRVDRRRAGVNNGLVGGRKRAGDIASSYLLHVRPMAGRHVESAGLRDFRQDVLPDFRKLSNDIIAEAAGGAGDD